MNFDETDLIERLHAVAAEFEMSPAPLADDVRRGRRRVRRIRVVVGGAAAAAVAIAIGVTTAGSGLVHRGSDDPDPVQPPGLVVGDVPVWYDAQGLHHGDVVEQTPVPISDLDPEFMSGALALVRSGAVYLDPATGDVWFHPWGGDPRIVGRDSQAGPGGDPNGDTAAWFEGSELVVYDTAAGREISRTESDGVTDCSGSCGDHYPEGNGFLQVSAERVVWLARTDSWSIEPYSLDLRTGITSVIPVPDGDSFADVHNQVAALGESESEALVVRGPGLAEERYPGLESHVRMSPSGSYVLAAERSEVGHGAVILDIRTGGQWRVPNGQYPWIAWSYGDIAMVNTESALLACDPTRRTCDRLQTERPFLMPTN